MRGSYAKEKLGSAVHTLATSGNDINNRLFYAFMQFHTLKESDFPNDLKNSWNEIYSLMTLEEPSYDTNGDVTTGKAENTIKNLSQQECEKIAELICSLNFEIVSYNN